MSTRAMKKIERALSIDGVAGADLTEYTEVKISAEDSGTGQLTFVAAGANDPLGVGYVLYTVKSGKLCHVILDNAIIPVLVGTGGATRSKDAVSVADGMTDAPVNGGGTTSKIIKGQFMQSGVAGDYVGMQIKSNRSVSA